jgi:acyl-coenzyme A thioesterase PaaI-like protein
VSDSVEEYGRRLRSGDVERKPGTLPPHHPGCYGCGPEAAEGLHVVARIVDGDIHASYIFEQRHTGAPGIAHGGLVAALLDDVSGFALFLVRAPAVTRRLEVDYLKPVLLGVRYDLVATVDSREGRKLWVTCEGRDPSGTLTFTSRGLFIVVDVSHFDRGSTFTP